MPKSVLALQPPGVLMGWPMWRDWQKKPWVLSSEQRMILGVGVGGTGSRSLGQACSIREGWGGYGEDMGLGEDVGRVY